MTTLYFWSGQTETKLLGLNTSRSEIIAIKFVKQH